MNYDGVSECEMVQLKKTVDLYSSYDFHQNFNKFLTTTAVSIPMFLYVSVWL
jgi:hypothetical protein